MRYEIIHQSNQPCHFSPVKFWEGAVLAFESSSITLFILFDYLDLLDSPTRYQTCILSLGFLWFDLI